MEFPNYFADAEASFEEADFVIFGVPYDKTSSFRYGAAEGPKEVRKSSWNFETFNIRTKVDIRDIKFHDYGDIEISNLKPSEVAEDVEHLTKKILSKNKFPIIIGGEHSITCGAIKAFPNNIGVLSLDAHMDFRDTYENERFNHACVIRRIAEYIDVSNIVVFGVRSAEKEEFEEAKKRNLFYISAFDIEKYGLKNALIEVKSYLRDKPIYITLDIDVIDPSFAPGVSTPEPFGLKPFDIIECLDFFAKNIVGFDVVEVCPNYDRGQSALLAAKFVRHAIEDVWRVKKD